MSYTKCLGFRFNQTQIQRRISRKTTSLISNALKRPDPSYSKMDIAEVCKDLIYLNIYVQQIIFNEVVGLQPSTLLNNELLQVPPKNILYF